MLDEFLKLSIKTRIIMVAVPIIILGAIVGSIVANNQNDIEPVSNIPENIIAENTIIAENIIENIIENEVMENTVAVEEKKEEKVKFKDKEVVIPKSKVSAANSAEDAEKSKKTGGTKVSQKQAQTMFENVGKKSMGIDVSQHQGKIDWAQVKTSGVDFAIIRVGYRGQSAGGIYEDRNFKSNMSGAIANGIKVGVYFYSTAINETEALEEAAWVVKKIAPYSITYPVVYDFEDFNAHRCSNVDGTQATKNAKTYLDYVKANGYEPMMYANKSDITSRMSRSSFSCKFWLAHYTSQTDYTGNVNMWQYTSKGSVPGISGNVDMNVAYFNYGTVAEPKHTHDFSEEVKNSYKAPTCDVEGSKVMACSCGEKETVTLEKVEHTWSDWKVIEKPTTKKVGKEQRICDVCKIEEDKEIEKLKENLDNTLSNVVNNTTNNTVNNVVNNTVNNVVNNVVNNTADNTVNNVVNNTTDDTKVENIVENNIDKNKVHEHVWKEVSRTEATCKENGTINYKCQDATCTEIKVDKETLVVTGNHVFENGSCTACGTKDPNYVEPVEPPVLENVVSVE